MLRFRPRRMAVFLAFAVVLGVAHPVAAGEAGTLVAVGANKAVFVWKDAGSMSKGLDMLGDGSFRQKPEELRALVACIAETGDPANGTADMRIRRRRADTVKHWEVEVTGGKQQGCKGITHAANFGPNVDTPSLAGKPEDARWRGKLVAKRGAMEAETAITFWKNEDAREEGVRLSRLGVLSQNLPHYVACVVPVGTKVGLLDSGMMFGVAVVSDGPQKGCVGHIEKANFNADPGGPLLFLVNKSSGQGEVAVWKDNAARQQGLALVREGIHRKEPEKIEALITCWAPHRAPVRLTGRVAEGGTDVEVADGPKVGCKGNVSSQNVSQN